METRETQREEEGRPHPISRSLSAPHSRRASIARRSAEPCPSAAEEAAAADGGGSWRTSRKEGT